MLINDIHNDLLNFYNNFYNKYSLANPFFIRNNNTLTWSNRLTPQRSIEYEEEYQWIVENNQYSLCLSDFGILQYYFETDRNTLLKGSLCFLPNPTLSHQYLRFDYDPNNSIEYEHTAAHMHYGYPSNMIRLSIEKIPYPSTFAQFILHNLQIDKLIRFNREKFFSLDIPCLNNHIFAFIV